MAIPQDWMPPGMTEDEKDSWTEAHPDDPHAAAAAAWESWAAQMDTSALDGASAVSTGAQTVSYAKGGAGAWSQAMSRADWHRARARVKSPKVGPSHVYGTLEVDTDRDTDSDVEFYGDDGTFLGTSGGRGRVRS